MLNQPTVDKLRALRLEGMCNAWIEQQSTPANTALSFDERLALPVDADNKRMTRTLKEAKLRFGKRRSRRSTSRQSESWTKL